MYTLKSQSTGERFLSVWSPLQLKAKPLSLLQWTKGFFKFASVYSNAYPVSTQSLFSYMFKVLDLASSQGDWSFYDREFRKDKGNSGYSFLAHRDDLYTKALTKGNYYRPQHNTSYQSSDSAYRQIPWGYCFAFHSKGNKCNSGAQCKFDHKCYSCKGLKPHPAYNCFHVNSKSVGY